MAFAGLLEALQGMTPDRVPDLPTPHSAELPGFCRRRCWPIALARPRQI